MSAMFPLPEFHSFSRLRQCTPPLTKDRVSAWLCQLTKMPMCVLRVHSLDAETGGGSVLGLRLEGCSAEGRTTFILPQARAFLYLLAAALRR